MASNDQVGAGQSVGRSGDDKLHKERTPENAMLERRRKFLLGGLATAPLISTLSSRPAWAGAGSCSISDQMSVHMSETATVCAGLDMEYWLSDPDHCDLYIEIGVCNPITKTDAFTYCTDYTRPTKQELKDARKAGIITKREALDYQIALDDNPPTMFNDVFGYMIDSELSMMECLTELGMEGNCVAAILNANEFGKTSYGYSVDDVIKLVQDMMLSDPLGLNATLEFLNSSSNRSV